MKLSGITEIDDLLNNLLSAADHAAASLFCAWQENKKISKKAKYDIFTRFEEIEKESIRLLQSGKFVEIPKMNILRIRNLARGYIGSYQVRLGDEDVAKRWFKQAAEYGINFQVRLQLEGNFSQNFLQNPKTELENTLGYSAKKDWSVAEIWLDRMQCKFTPFFSFVPYVVCRFAILTLLFMINKNMRPEAVQIAVCKHGIPDWDPCDQCIESHALLGYSYLNDNKPRLGKYLLEKACKAGSNEARLFKAICLLEGKGYARDVRQALLLLQTIKANNAAEDVNNFFLHIEYLPKLYFLLGDLYKNGVAGEQHKVQGDELIKNALALGFNQKNDYFVNLQRISNSKQTPVVTANVHEDQPKSAVEKILHAKRNKNTNANKGLSIISKLSSFALTIASLPKKGWLQLTSKCVRKKQIVENSDGDLFAEDQPKPVLKKAKSTGFKTSQFKRRLPKKISTNITESKAAVYVPTVKVADDETSESESQPGAPITPRSDSSASSLDIQPGQVSPVSVSQPSSTGSPILDPKPIDVIKEDTNLTVWQLQAESTIEETKEISIIRSSSEIKLEEEHQQRLAYRAKMADFFGVVCNPAVPKQLSTERVYSAKELQDEYKINLGELRNSFPPLVNSVLVNFEKGKDHEVRIGGGAVRKLLLLGKASGDWDITTTVPPDTIQQIIKSLVSDGCKLESPKGKIPVWTLIAADGLAIDVTPFLRYESYRGGKYELVVSEKEIDPMTRNLSINSLFLRRKKGSWEWELVDLTGHGLKDLMVDKVIRINGDPNIIFHLDPIRLLHCFYFRYELGFKFEEMTQKGIRSFKSFLSGLGVGEKPLQLLKMLFKILKLPSIVRQACLLELKDEGVLNILSDILDKGFDNAYKYPGNFVRFYQTIPSIQYLFDHLIYYQNPNAFDKCGQLILHQTIAHGNIIGVALLLCVGANPLIKNKFQCDAYNVVEQCIHDPQHKKILSELMQNFSGKSEKEMVNLLCNLLKTNSNQKMIDNTGITIEQIHKNRQNGF